MEKQMTAYYVEIDTRTQQNDNFQEVLFTTSLLQLVVMSLRPEEDLGLETQTETDQFIQVQHGTGKAILDGKEYRLEPGSAVVIPAGTEYNLINTSANDALKLYAIYIPPEHPNGTIHRTKAEAEVFENETYK
jgi:mannose-6-phosphate isomerase-like protein (cupin superfamily)